MRRWGFSSQVKPYTFPHYRNRFFQRPILLVPYFRVLLSGAGCTFTFLVRLVNVGSDRLDNIQNPNVAGLPPGVLVFTQITQSELVQLSFSPFFSDFHHYPLDRNEPIGLFRVGNFQAHIRIYPDISILDPTLD